MAAKKKPDYLKVAADGSFIDITLMRGIDVDGAKVTALRMREPTVADQETAVNMDGEPATLEIFYLANLCEVSPDQIRKLSVRDFKRIQEAYAVFTD